MDGTVGKGSSLGKICESACTLKMWSIVVLVCLCAVHVDYIGARPTPKNGTARLLDPTLMDKIKSFQDVVDQIIAFSTTGPGANQSYNRLATFVDKFGNRLSGSQNLEDSIDYMLEVLQQDGLDNVHGEKVNVTRWVRNQEYAKLVSPRAYDMAITGLGGSVGTDGELTAEAFVVRSFDDLAANPDKVNGKIVVYNQDFVSYPDTAVYRVAGASKAAQYGAVATLIRSVTPQSIYSPHTGIQEYNNDYPKIPTACITVEDAEMLDRMQARNEEIKITLFMGAQNLAPSISRNTVAEIKGSVYPDQVVLVSGHLDSWDVGQGAMDDGGGAFVSWQALSILRQMNLTPKRTLRVVMWTDEEAGGVGSEQYFEAHQSEASNFNIMFESDIGVFLPYGIQFTGSHLAKGIMQEIGKLLSSINATSVGDDGGETDTAWWAKLDVPLGTLSTHNEKYFWFHHSNGDTMTVLNPNEMNHCAAVFAVYSYVLGTLDDMLPRK